MPAMPSLTIDPAFRDLIPPLAPDELALLEASIVAEGVREPLIVWPTETGTILIDGHNRFAICQRHGVPFATRAMAFPDRDTATRWIIENQMGRRNLTPYARSILALRLKDAYAVQAKSRQGTRSDLAPNIGENSPPSRTAAALSRLAGVSNHTLKRAACRLRK
jgi:ParB-like chromosome segregation protein Spo0J